jgi:succinate dehydrogenase/fumarate reductase flavoprotein subunit
MVKLLLINLHQFPGNCQGVIALNMEDGTLHRFRASNTILATGVSHLTNLGTELFVYVNNSDEFAFAL